MRYQNKARIIGSAVKNFSRMNEGFRSLVTILERDAHSNPTVFACKPADESGFAIKMLGRETFFRLNFDPHQTEAWQLVTAVYRVDRYPDASPVYSYVGPATFDLETISSDAAMLTAEEGSPVQLQNSTENLLVWLIGDAPATVEPA